MKRCPHCAEEIQDEAVVCKHCGRQLETTTKKSRIDVSAWLVLLVLVLITAFCVAVRR